MPNSNFGKSIAWVFVILGVLVLMLGGYGYVQYLIFHQRVEELKEQGIPVSYPELVSEVTDPDRDMAAIIMPIVGDVEQFASAIPNEAYSDESQFVSDEGLAAFEQQQALYPELYETLGRVALAGDTSQSLTRETVSPLLWIKVFNLFRWRAKIDELRGNPDAAAESYLSILRISNSNKSLSLIPCFLTQAGYAQAVEGFFGVVARNQVTPAIVKEFDTLLGEFDFRKSLENALNGERVFMIANLIDPTAMAGDWPDGRNFIAKIPGGPIGVYGNAILDDIQKAQECLNLPLTESKEIETVSSALGLYDNAYERMVARSRNKLGLQQVYYQAFKLLTEIKSNCDLGHPKGVKEYIAAYPERRLVDPFTGGKLIVKLENNRIQIYSSGVNRADDNLAESSDDIGVESFIK